MATATKPKASKKDKDDPKPMIEIGVEYGNISIGEKTASVGVSFSRGQISLTKAAENFCERRLTGCIIAKPAGWNSDDQALPGMEEDVELHGVFDVASIRFTSKAFAVKLSFRLNEIDVSTIAEFAKRSGRLSVFEVADLPDGDEEGEGDE
jgi:hypothetical protein